MPIERIKRIAGRAIPLRGDNVDTDRIIPARFLKSITFEGLERHLFEDDRQQLEAEGARHPTADAQYSGARILLVNANFGCGSSREHAPQAIRRSGIQVVVGQSFSEIFFGNSVALGMPCVSADARAMETLMAAVENDPTVNITVDLESMTVAGPDCSFDLTLPPGSRESFLEGSWDATGLLLDRFEEVQATAARLPYLQWS
jgi:3-isopropylmalate/(R)-2-methylmalate dehydratase small subunit